MIHKAYHPNGSPDLRRWTAQCDNKCPNTVPMLEVAREGWLYSKRAGALFYCPPCIEVWAMCLISWALICPVCGSPQLILGTNSNGIAELVLCDGQCCSTYLAADGWHCICCGDPLTTPEEGTHRP